MAMNTFMPISHLVSMVTCLLLISPGLADQGTKQGLLVYSFHSDNSSRLLHRFARGLAPEVPYSKEAKKAILDAHNKYRSMTKAADMLRMEWDDDLEKEATAFARKCIYEHGSPNRNVGKFNTVGENLAAQSGSIPFDPVDEPINLFYDEIKDYNYGKIKSPGSCKANKVCGHYTQVIWSKTYAVGCAISYCEPVKATTYATGHLVVCIYGPGGNVVGRFPYKKGAVCSDCPEDYKNCVDSLCSKPGSHARGIHAQTQPLNANVLASLFVSAIFAAKWTRQLF